MAALPRGIRNHNPGNIEKGDPWQGLAEHQPDPRFCVFKAPEWGIRAIARILINYRDKHGINTISGIVNRWAPSAENDTGSYVHHVASRVGVGPDDIIDVTRYDICRPLVEAIIRHENGISPHRPDGRWYDSATINRGLELAGIEVPRVEQAMALDEERPLTRSRTTKGAAVTMTGGGAVAAEGFAEVLDAMESGSQQISTGSMIQIAVGLIIIACACWMLYARFDDRRKGLR